MNCDWILLFVEVFKEMSPSNLYLPGESPAQADFIIRVSVL